MSVDKKSQHSKLDKSKISNKDKNSPSPNKNTMNQTNKSKTSKKSNKDGEPQNPGTPARPGTQPEKIVSARAYLEQNVTAVVQEGMLELVKNKPENPLEYLGNFILQRAKNYKK